MASITWEFDKERWNRSIQAVVAASKKAEADVVNRALMNVAFRSAQYTPKTSASDIQQELLDNKTALRIVTARLRAKVGTSATTKAGKTRKITRVTRKQIGAAARRLIAQRKKGSGAERAGWIPPILALGGSYRGERVEPGGAASRSYAVPASIVTMEGLIANAYYGSLKGSGRAKSAQGMVSALQRAVTRVRRENTVYATKKIGEALEKCSDR